MECLNCHVGRMQIPQDQHPSYLICDSCGALELRYVAQDYQNALHTQPIVLSKDGSPYPQILFVAGGFGSGKSRSSLQEFFMRCLENPNGSGLITAPTLQQLKRTSIKTLLDEIIPPPLIESYNKSDMEIKLINGFAIYAVASDDETKLRSLNLGLCHIEEASGINKSIYVQLTTRLRDPNVKIKTMFVCTNPDGGWVRDTFVLNNDRKDPNHPEHKDYSPFISCHIWPTRLNKFLPPNFAELASAGRPSWWREKFLEGSFDYQEGAVYPNAMKTVVEPFDIPKNWERVIGADFGLRNPTAVLFGAINPEEGELVIYDEYYVRGKTVPEHAEALKPRLDKIGHGQMRFMVADPSMRNRNPVNGKSIQGQYQEYGIYFSPGNNQMESGLLKVNSYIERGKLKIFKTCVETLRELLNYKFPEVSIDHEKNLDEKPVKYEDHAADALRYIISQLPENPNDLKTMSYEPPTKWYNRTSREDFEDLGYDLVNKDWTEVGY